MESDFLGLSQLLYWSGRNTRLTKMSQFEKLSSLLGKKKKATEEEIFSLFRSDCFISPGHTSKKCVNQRPKHSFKLNITSDCSYSQSWPAVCHNVSAWLSMYISEGGGIDTSAICIFSLDEWGRTVSVFAFFFFFFFFFISLRSFHVHSLHYNETSPQDGPESRRWLT